MTQPLPYPRRPPSSEELICSDGEPMESARHVQQMMVLIESLEHAWRERDDYYVGGNMFLYFSETQAKHNDFRGPDVFVTLDTTRRERHAWVVWEEDGKAPDVIIELLSDSTEQVDRGEKMRIYGFRRSCQARISFAPYACPSTSCSTPSPEFSKAMRSGRGAEGMPQSSPMPWDVYGASALD